MQQWNSFARRFFMTCLFIGALLTTFQAITGMTMNDLKHKYFQKDHIKQNGMSRSNIPGLNKTAINQMPLKIIKRPEAKLADTVVHRPKKLYDTIKLKKYPKHRVVATGYTAGVESTGKSPGDPTYGITYSGVKVRRDLYSTIAADTHVFPIGTILYIPNYGYGVVADTGSAINGNRLDLYFDTVDDVYREWGKRVTDVYVIHKGEGTLTEQTLKRLNNNKSLQVFREKKINE